MTVRNKVPVFGTPDQVPLHGVVTTSYTMICEEGTLEAKALLAPRVLQQVESSCDERSFSKATDALAPMVLSKRAMTAVTALPDFGDSLTTLDDLSRRYAHLRDIESGNTNSTTRAIHTSVQAVLCDHHDMLRKTLVAVFDASPRKVREAVAEVRRRLLEFSSLETSPKHVQKLRSNLTTIQEFSHFESEVTAEPYGRVQAALLQEGRAEAEKALNEVALRKVCKLSAEHKGLLETSLKDLESKSQAHRRRLSDVYDHFDKRQKQATREETDRMSTACLALAGPDKDRVLTGLKSALSCADLSEVTNTLAVDFEAGIRDYAKRECPHIVAESASIPALILEIEAVHLVNLFDRIVENHLGHGHSPYQLLEAYGLERAVKYLYGRAAPTCSFSGRDCETLGVSPDELSIVRLPKARTPEDEQIRTRLEKRFERLPKCKVTEGGEAEREILLTRVQGGWPIGIEDANSICPF